jgi:ABC-type phosphonate transport system ATPase subunit
MSRSQARLLDLIRSLVRGLEHRGGAGDAQTSRSPGCWRTGSLVMQRGVVVEAGLRMTQVDDHILIRSCSFRFWKHETGKG